MQEKRAVHTNGLRWRMWKEINKKITPRFWSLSLAAIRTCYRKMEKQGKGLLVWVDKLSSLLI